MAAFEEYLSAVSEKITALKSQKKVIDDAAATIFESLKAGGVWHVFGSGHSSMAVQEVFHRAGGLVPVNPWLESFLMPHVGPRKNGPMERLEGVAKVLFDAYAPLAGETITIISNSGINAASVDMAMLARKAGVKVVAVTSLTQSKESKSRHSSGKRLFELADFVIDTGGVKGDAAVHIKGLDVAAGPMSSLLAGAVMNLVALRVCELYSAAGLVAPVYLSANLPGGDERNRALEEKYRGRIRIL